MSLATEFSRRPSTVVVGVDGSPASEAALRWAVGHAALSGAAVRAVIVTSPRFIPAVAGDGFELVAGFDAFDARSALERCIERAVPNEAQRAAIERRTAVGSLVERLLEETGNAALVVVGQSGRSLSRRLLGGTRHLVARATCPVVVVPAAEEACVAVGRSDWHLEDARSVALPSRTEQGEVAVLAGAANR